ncbi:MAG: SOS response-associated peptidase [Pseudodesulfovibrio sp.]
MCGRFALGIPKIRLEECFSVAMPDDYAPRYNVAPGQEAVAVIAPDGAVRSAALRWGLVPSWAKETKVGFSMINARSETVFDKPAFRESVRSSRCLIPAQAFYEWKKTGTTKQPHALTINDMDVFAMAGITAHWEDRTTGEIVDSFTILTCPPNTLMASIHDRMPVILPPDAWSDWLDPAISDPQQLAMFFTLYPAEAMHAWPISPAVNKPINDGPELLHPVQILQQGSLL